MSTMLIKDESDLDFSTEHDMELDQENVPDPQHLGKLIFKTAQGPVSQTLIELMRTRLKIESRKKRVKDGKKSQSRLEVEDFGAQNSSKSQDQELVSIVSKTRSLNTSSKVAGRTKTLNCGDLTSPMSILKEESARKPIKSIFKGESEFSKLEISEHTFDRNIANQVMTQRPKTNHGGNRAKNGGTPATESTNYGQGQV